MNQHHDPSGPATDPQITLRGPAELADALPYMMGFHPNDSIVLVALHGNHGRFGGRLRLGIPRSPREWQPVAGQLAECLIHGCERRGSRPDGIVVFLCQDPAGEETGLQVMERLRPLAQRLRTACGALDVPVYEALCISDGRCWSYCCPDARCCPPEGTPLALPGTSVMAAAAAYAGIQVRGSLRDLEGRFAPAAVSVAQEQIQALDDAGAALVPRILEEQGRRQVAAETLDLARKLVERMASTPLAGEGAAADVADDRLITPREAALVILGLQDRETRDRAAEWMEGPEAPAALRLWRALSRRCSGAYFEHAAAPLTLAGWVSWSTGDEPGARVALGLALRADPEYVFARLLHQACNEGLDPETLRSCLRRTRDEQPCAAVPDAPGTPETAVPAGSPGPPGAFPTLTLPGATRRRPRRVRASAAKRQRVSVRNRPGAAAAAARTRARAGMRSGRHGGQRGGRDGR
ncbi:DUF4192 domain-containing protein [Streptomyces sp. NBC_00390]|uniref:DUF4192 domain-containing protein n=1 Tax=Streptomyces sp. NBC_00390 TaxID=2975736 RepID=UPI002E2511A8